MERLSKFIDTSKCTACRGCQTACKSWNQLPAEIKEFKGSLQTHEKTTPQTFTYVKMIEKHQNGRLDWFFMKNQCMHCQDAACKKVCPENAISHNDYGAVVVDREKCIGCGYCSRYCPFGVPAINEAEKKMYKCHQCSDRVENGLLPACAKTCATGAIAFGPRQQMLARAKERLYEVKKEFPKANLYGLDEQFLEGTNTFYLLLDKPEVYGLPASPSIPFEAGLWQDFIQPLGKIFPVAALGAILVSTVMTRVVKPGQNGGHGPKNDSGDEPQQGRVI